MSEPEEHKSSSAKRNSYTPYILPEWINECKSDKLDHQEPKIIQLTDENASRYTELTSHVGWRRRVDYALKNLEKNKNINQDSSIITYLLENVISTVIVLASDGTIPDEYLLNSHIFLRKIRNEFGDNPPNIAAFLEFLKTKASEEVLSIMKSISNSEIEKLPSNLIISRIPKDLQTKISKQ